MTVLLQQYMFSFRSGCVNEFCTNEDLLYFHFQAKKAGKQLKKFKKDKNKSRRDFENLLILFGLDNLHKSVCQTSCDDITAEVLFDKALRNNKILGSKTNLTRHQIKQFKRERKQLERFRKIYLSMTDLEKIAIGRGKELPNLSLELIIQLSTLTSQK
ncbi:hypothetical protein M0813_18458 [Anaeramoeba flamelloides]|uniref:Uncharacterized protein n=1 Tax=Anaeramoeba flamelloides TaxID=1746091 RepID=A0AAV7Z0I2_9EUKA|nr:hypothetical protein M0812_19752 [Anaeramoeba flamelloides]KAJ6247823.1 hypothetical protein M0813_18458 [Anaeramoeba flamelloides]